LKDTSGANFLELLTLMFIYLKLTSVISWSWWVVLSPLIAVFIFTFFSVLADEND